MSKIVFSACMCLALGCSRAGDKNKEQIESKAGTDVLSKVTFETGGSINSKQEKTLKLSASSGWTWAFLPEEIDLNRHPRLTMSLKTTEKCIVYLELKDKKGGRENPLVGKNKVNEVWKMKLEVPNTSSQYKDVVLDLTEHYRPEPKSRLAKVIVFSDPEGDIEIESIKFEEKPK